VVVVLRSAGDLTPGWQRAKRQVAMEYADRARPAVLWFRRGYRLQQAGQVEDAIRSYRHSLTLYPTAEAHTYLGWAISFGGRYDDAIAECKAAIAIDPDYGNPYNDIGVYLIHLGREDDAIPWLHKAMTAPRYEARCYPHFNLGGILERRGLLRAALTEYRRALEIEPGYTFAREAAARVSERLGEP
jgi:tetratricopeptide (TPR) repeat protein